MFPSFFVLYRFLLIFDFISLILMIKNNITKCIILVNKLDILALG